VRPDQFGEGSSRARTLEPGGNKAVCYLAPVPTGNRLTSIAGLLPRWLWAVLLLTASNIFMTFAWYYHFKQKAWPLLTAIVISWLIALPEYMLQVPANRLGHVFSGGPFSVPQLMISQDGITLRVFAVFSILVLKEKLRWADAAGMGLVFAGVAVVMWGKGRA